MISNTLKIAGKRFKEYRKLRGISIDFIISKINGNLTSSDLKNFEKGIFDIDAISLFEACNLIDLPIQYIFDIDEGLFNSFLNASSTIYS